ncbi:deoxyribonuclease IV [Cetobacterium sp. 2A]|uniref:deoxyribonuclease IV n=1 Tax=Cetobacterium sp. 2A TaxID=2754723 RepID=UPI00163B7EC4|nr:deoxyribonuclease IV [Cetobacterium sp. 2A]MBC2856783.1 deoxyribonuclease IV [Cetobacterium sp. 2A]
MNKKINKFIGAHVSATGGPQATPVNAKKIGAKAFGMFVKNQRRWDSKPLTEKEIIEFKAAMAENGYTPEQVLPHDGYLINLGSPDPEKREKSLNAFIDEMDRVNRLGLIYLNMHPGSHLKEISEEECLGYIAESINAAHKAIPNVIIVMENTAGQGSNMGYTFDHLGKIIEMIEDKSRIGVCIDTCHTLTAGYELKDEAGYNKTMDEFEKKIGFKYLKGVHLNDSKFDTGTKKDRHDSIGKGVMGMDFFERIMNDSRFDNIPIILETIDDTIWKEEIEMLYGLIK